MPRLSLAALVAVSVFAMAPAVGAQEPPADQTAFNEACAGAQQFLLGEVPAEIDPTSIMTPLCGCLATSLKDMPQKDIDILAADLRGEGTQEAHDAHGAYTDVEDKARIAVTTCFASPEVQAVMPTPAEPAVEEAAPAEPAPVAPAQ